MKVSVLSNDKAKEGFKEEKGLSLFIEHDGKKILFDTGTGETLFENSEKLGINPLEVDFIVLSHGHSCHAGGMEAILEKKTKAIVVCHERAFVKRYEKKGDLYLGMPVTSYEIEGETTLAATKKQHALSEGITFLGEIPRKNEFEGKRNIGYYFDNDRKKDDFVVDDSALAIKTDKGLVIFTGCAHSGIKNICEYSKEAMKEHKILAVIGGLHLDDAFPNTIGKTARYLKEQGIENIYPLHCACNEALKEFDKEALAYKTLLAGDAIEL